MNRAMNRLRSFAFAFSLLVMAAGAPAETVVMGRIPAFDNGSEQPFGGTPLTIVDLGHPAAVGGTIASASVRWVEPSSTCPNAFKIKVFRQEVGADIYDLVAARGPFATTMPVPTSNTLGQGVALVTVALDPPVTVQPGDFIAVTNYTSSGCGGVSIVKGLASETIAAIPSDFNGGAISGVRRGYIAGVRASTTSEALTGIVPVIGAVAGAAGSQFRTVFQITNPAPFPISPTFVFHPSGHPASPSDPRTSLFILPLASSSTTDILASLGVSNGLGSLDILSTGEPAPLVTTHVFNETGNGTNGFFEPQLTHEDALSAGVIYIVPIATDLTNYRVNVGVRSLSEGTTLLISELDASGVTVAGSSKTKTYAADFFEQVPLSTFLSPAAAVVGGAIQIQAFGGAIIYTSITDNHTNDSAITFVKTNPE